MKPLSSPQSANSSSAFTLTQLLVGTGLMILVVGSVIVSQIGGLKLIQQVETNVRRGEEWQAVLNKLGPEVREAKVLDIGTGNLSSFTEIGSKSTQIGTGIRMYMSTNTNSFIRYYVDTADKKLKRATNNTVAKALLDEPVTNVYAFRAENHQGVVLTNRENSFTLSIYLDFHKTNRLPSHLQTKITRRAVE